MKRLLSILLCFLLLFGIAKADYATPTDLYEIIEDDDYGFIEDLPRQVFLQWEKEPKTLGEEVTLVAILVNFKPEDKYRFEWERSEVGQDNWQIIDNETEQTYTFILTKESCDYQWRVKVIMEE